MTIDELYAKLSTDFGDRFDRMESRIANLESRIANLESRITNLESRFDRMESRIGNLESRIGNLESRIANLESRIANLESDTKALKEETHRINLKIENDVGGRLDALATKDDLQDELLHPIIDDSVDMRYDPLEARVAALEAGFKELKLKIG